jgi:hypothetical protein
LDIEVLHSESGCNVSQTSANAEDLGESSDPGNCAILVQVDIMDLTLDELEELEDLA